jgi:hypothetical protein
MVDRGWQTAPILHLPSSIIHHLSSIPRLPLFNAKAPRRRDAEVEYYNTRNLSDPWSGRTFEALATNTLGDGFMASPTVDGKAFYLRSKTHLSRVEAIR